MHFTKQTKYDIWGLWRYNIVGFCIIYNENKIIHESISIYFVNCYQKLVYQNNLFYIIISVIVIVIIIIYFLTGLLCHLEDACISNPCHRTAECHTSVETGNYECTCAEGFTGTNCSVDINECRCKYIVLLNQ